MLNEKAFAHAVTVVMAVFYILCVIFSYMAPDFIFGIAQTWIHTVNIESLKSQSTAQPGSILWGFITISALSWVTTYFTIWTYNKLAK